MPDNETVSIDDMKACVGSLLFLWADIERELRDQVASQFGTILGPTYGMAACLRSWRRSIDDAKGVGQFRGELAECLVQQLQHARTMRNRLCHGLTGYSSGSGRSAQLSWRLNGENGRLSFMELQDSFSWLARIPRALSLLSGPSVVGRFDRCVDTAENRQWWQTEFALSLSGEGNVSDRPTAGLPLTTVIEARPSAPGVDRLPPTLSVVPDRSGTPDTPLPPALPWR